MKILIIRFSSIGDIVLTTPVIRCLKQQLPGSEIHVITKIHYLSLLNANPYVDKVYAIRKKVSEVMQELKMEKYDLIIDLHKNIRSLQLKFQLGVKSFSFPKLNFKKWLLTNFKINLLPDVHIVDRYFEAVAPLQVTNDGCGLDFFIPEHEVVSVEEAFSPDFVDGFIVLVVGSKQFTKQIPVEKIIEICDKLKSPVILLGGENDFQMAEVVKTSSKGIVWNGCGFYSLNQSASIIQQAKVVICPDTGMMHIAAALQKYVISLWGSTTPAFGMYPYYPLGKGNFSMLQVQGLSCRPCSKIGYRRCPKKHFNCMMHINMDEVVALAEK